ncbi:glycine oxidase ThiO [Paenibacillus turpanensis]|uniref:glycine oxidase ThiO n=1 Tax=Paenibacillus turpanensis TaxID=2689078 RepID=UPI001408C785|nr:glycine oxidase ThiO [Paenibacillus turpanensis]
MSQRIIVIGGGVIGLSVAFECSRRGHQVTVLEKGGFGGQASGAAAGMLAPFSENGEGADPFFRLCLESLKLYGDWQSDVKKASGLDFEYENTGSLYAAYHDADLLALETRRQWQKPFGSEPEIIEGERLFRLEPSLSREVRAALFHPDETHIYAPDYVKALEAACLRGGVQLIGNVVQLAAEVAGGRVHLKDAAGRTYEADRYVVSNGAWSGEWQQALGLNIPVYPIRGQICAYHLNEELAVSHMVFASQGYVVPKANGSLVCGASEDIAGFDTSVTERGIQRLQNWNKRLYPALERMEPFHRWAGLRPATQDGYPLLGELSRHPEVVMATGHYRNGILLSPVTAHAAADVIDGRQPPVDIARFAPERFGASTVAV